MAYFSNLSVIAPVLALTGVGFADVRSDEALVKENIELLRQLDFFDARLAAVEADDDWLTDRRAAEIRGLVQDVLADADTRTAMMSQGVSAGYDDGVVIGSNDGNWMLRADLLLQTRFMFNTQSGAPAGTDGTVWGFEVTRARFMLSGHVVDPTWFYRVDIETSTNGAAFVIDPRTGLLNAFVGKDFGNGWRVSGGQFKVPLLHGELVEAQYQQAVERSYLTYLYTGSYSQGIMAEWSSDQFNVKVSWNNGINDVAYGGGVVTAPGGSTQPILGNSALATDTQWAVTGRFEWLAAGTWQQFKDYTSPQGEEMGVMVGAAIHVQDAEDQVSTIFPGTVPVTLTVLTVDASAEFGGANVYGALIYVNADPTGGATANPWGFEVGGGWYFSEDWELFAHYQYSDLDTVLNDLSVLSFGVNRYLSGHNLKWTTDFLFGIDSVPSTIPVTGLRSDTQGQDGQFVLRSQLQVLF